LQVHKGGRKERRRRHLNRAGASSIEKGGGGIKGGFTHLSGDRWGRMREKQPLRRPGSK